MGVRTSLKDLKTQSANAKGKAIQELVNTVAEHLVNGTINEPKALSDIIAKGTIMIMADAEESGIMDAVAVASQEKQL